MKGWRQYFIPLFILTIMLCSAFSAIQTKIPKIVQAAQTTPDLADGPEHQRRVVGYNHIIDLKNKFPHVVVYSSPHSHYEKQVALTFDDGPDLEFTPKILDILKKYNINATFFIVGKRAKAHPEMVKRISDEGHAIGNHSWDHPDIAKLTPERLKTEVAQTEQILSSILGYYPSIFRPPYGAATQNDVIILSSLGYRVIDWSVDTRDWAGTPVDQIMNYVHKEIKPGGIVLEHCAGGKGEDLSNTVEALPKIISYLKSQGYRFVTIPQVVNHPAL